jgi:serine/threonine-protein kinase
MTVPTSVEFIADLRAHQLLQAEQLHEVDQLAALHADMKGLARELIQRGWLTPFQVNQISKGKAAELVLDQYVLLELIGQGGMGTVYRAVQRRMKRVVAVKVVRPEILQTAGAGARFQREAETIARLAHPNVVTVHDTNEANGVRFLVMEYLEGVDLSRLVKEQGPLSVEKACDYIRQAALGLDHAHEHGLVHRDVKPANLLLTRHGVVKVMDLGLARLHEAGKDSASHGLTETGAVLGTTDYLAPEQARDAKSADRRADLYSLGCTLYFLLTGQPPFSGETATEKLLKHQLEEAPPLEKFRDDVPPALAELVRKLMAKRPEERFPGAAAAATALERFTAAAAIPVAELSGDETVRLTPTRVVPVLPVGPARFRASLGIAPTAAPFADPSSETLPSLRLPPAKGRRVRLAVAATVAAGVALLAVIPAWVWFFPPKATPVAVATEPAAVRPTLAPATKPSADPEQALVFYRRGCQDLEARRYDDALRDFTRSIELNPESADAYFERAHAHMGKRANDEALADFQTVVRLDPKNAQASFIRGTIWDGKGDREQAMRDYSAAIAVNPGHTGALVNRGALYYNAGDYRLAIRDCSTVLAADGQNIAARLNRSRAFAQLNQLDKALNDVNRVIEINPTLKSAYALRSHLYTKMGDDDKAREDQEKAKGVAREKSLPG